LVGWVVVRLLGLERGFPLVPLMAYTPYVTIVALLAAGLAAALRNWAAALVAAACLAVLSAVVLPRALGGAEEAPPGATVLDVISVNVHRGTAGAGALLDLVDRRDADVLSVQELTPAFALELEQKGIGTVLPHGVLSVRGDSSGGGVYARRPVRPLPSPSAVGFRMPRAALRLAGDRTLGIVAVHPFPPRRDSIALWRAGLDSLPAAGSGGMTWILPGDFNATLDHAELRELMDSGYRDAAEVVGAGLQTTWPARRLIPPAVTIDHILAEEGIRVADFAVETVPGTDHRALYARLAVE
jgi:endonuclease/exonuclease/phosphatase (EEP) superfamily protein YafD